MLASLPSANCSPDAGAPHIISTVTTIISPGKDYIGHARIVGASCGVSMCVSCYCPSMSTQSVCSPTHPYTPCCLLSTTCPVLLFSLRLPLSSSMPMLLPPLLHAASACNMSLPPPALLTLSSCLQHGRTRGGACSGGERRRRASAVGPGAGPARHRLGAVGVDRLSGSAVANASCVGDQHCRVAGDRDRCKDRARAEASDCTRHGQTRVGGWLAHILANIST